MPKVIVVGAACVVSFCCAARTVTAQPGDGRGGPGAALLRALDADGSGDVSAEEIQKAAEALKGLDRNGDGRLTRNELAPAGVPRGPAGRGPRAGTGRGGGPGGFGFPSGSGLEKPPLPKDDVEKRVLTVLDEISEGPWYANVSPNDGRFLRQLTEAVGAKQVVELGTSSGYSGIWFALALRETGGKLFTHEIDPERVKLARQNFRKAGVDDVITIIEGDAHQTVSQHKGPIDVLFLDADKEGYVDYLKKLLPLVRPGGLILAHNMNRPAPDPNYIKAITTDANLDTTFVLMDGAGIGVTLKKR